MSDRKDDLHCHLTGDCPNWVPVLQHHVHHKPKHSEIMHVKPGNEHTVTANHPLIVDRCEGDLVHCHVNFTFPISALNPSTTSHNRD